VDRATIIDADKIGAQFFHGSPAGDVAASVAIGHPGFTSEPSDAGAFKSISDGGVVALGQSTRLTEVSGVNLATDYFRVSTLTAFAGPLQQIQAISYPTGVPDGGAYGNGKAFTFISVGDPTTTPDGGGGGAVFNTRYFHYLALPNDPTPVNYAP